MARRWGIMGTGSIAALLLAAIRAEGSEVVAVSSADVTRARHFADEHGVPRAYGPHHDLLTHADLDVVYVATTNERHHGDALACVTAGIPVLVEKPFTLNLRQARQVLGAARESGTFLMEAMWMRFQPAFLELERRIDAGDIGEPTTVQADFGFAAPQEEGSRLYDPRRGGGALLDIGIYPLTLAVSILGEPTSVAAVADLTGHGVDRQHAVSMQHDRGVSGWVASLAADTGVEATVAGRDGALRLHGPFHNAPSMSLRRGTGTVETIRFGDAELGYRYEVREVERCLDEGLPESPRMSHAFTGTVMRWLDEIRAIIGVTYPGDGTGGGNPGT